MMNESYSFTYLGKEDNYHDWELLYKGIKYSYSTRDHDPIQAFITLYNVAKERMEERR